jgi:hypothetical protein
VVIALVWLSEEFTLQKFGLGWQNSVWSVLRRGQRVGTGSVCYICVLLVLSCVIKGQRYIFCCTTKPVLSSWIYFVSKEFHNRVIFFVV